MHRRFFVATLATALANAQQQQRRLGVVAKIASRDLDTLIHAAATTGANTLEVDGAMLPSDLAGVRGVRDRFSQAKLRVQAVSWQLANETGLRSKLAAANVLDARYVVTTNPGEITPKVQAESIATGVPVALRNGASGLRSPEEIVEVLRVNSHLALAFDPGQMLSDGHDPVVFVRRVVRRLTTVYIGPKLEQSTAAMLRRIVLATRGRATVTIEASPEEFPSTLKLLRTPAKP